MPYTMTAEIARRNGVRPRDISDLFYRRVLSDERCPVIAGRRLIPVDYEPTIVAALKKHGYLKAAEITAPDHTSLPKEK
jgi:hypothetical protein